MEYRKTFEKKETTPHWRRILTFGLRGKLNKIKKVKRIRDAVNQYLHFMHTTNISKYTITYENAINIVK